MAILEVGGSMYKSVIDIRNDIPEEVLKVLAAKADAAFDNRAGKVRNSSTAPYRFVYEGGEAAYACLEVGMLTLKRDTAFLSSLSTWHWVDDDPDECCDLLRLFTTRK